MTSFPDFAFRYPLMDSTLIGFKAPPQGTIHGSCSPRVLNYIHLWEASCHVKSIDIRCDMNIWSTTFRSQFPRLSGFRKDHSDQARYDANESDSTDNHTDSSMGLGCSGDLPMLLYSDTLNTSLSSVDEETFFPSPPPSYEFLPFDVSQSAKFFVIKSYNGLDVATSIENKIWASTDLGNKRLDKAYRDSNGEVFLFFSVNGSSKFCGVAKMLDKVDFSKSSNAWVESSRWKGIFPVDWLICREISNKAFRRLRVPTNENKPVSNSRDTQELPANIGLSMLAIFSAGSS